jgi:hypothetical protein
MRPTQALQFFDDLLNVDGALLRYATAVLQSATCPETLLSPYQLTLW